MAADDEKRWAAQAAADLVMDGMAVGLGTGSTVDHLLPALAELGPRDLRCVATSERTERQARELGLPVEPFDQLTRLDIAIDGADEIAPDRWLIKGGGGAHTREKVVAAAADRFVVIADASKDVERLSWAVPLELLPFGLGATLRAVGRLGDVRLRDAPPSPDGGVIADVTADLSDPERLSAQLSAIPGLVDHGLFPPALVSDVIVARGTAVDHRRAPR
jgi:ribose 5-phosphate isomerase A